MFTNRQEVYNKVRELAEDFRALGPWDVRDDDGLHDCINSKCVYVDIWALTQLIFTESLFAQLCDEVEDDKSSFIVQKTSRRFFDEALLPQINGLIDFSKRCQFHDYRAINLQSDTKKLMTEIKDFYSEMYQ